MRYLTALLLASSVFASSAIAQPLPNGKPAGVKPAQGMKTTEIYFFALAGVAAIALGAVWIGKSGSTSGTSS